MLPETPSSNRLRAACLALVTATLAGVLSACGGGGGADPAAKAPATAAASLAQAAPAAISPSLQSVSPSVLTPPARIVLSGEGFDQVESVRLGDSVLPIVSRAPAWLEVDVPAGATTQFLTLVERNATPRRAVGSTGPDR